MAAEELIVTYRGIVYPYQCDHMGHMNVMWYVSKFDEATWFLASLTGVTPTYMRQNNRGMVAAEQKIFYKREVLAGGLVYTRSGFTEVKEKSVRFFHEMINQETGEIAAITLLTGVHIDTQLRKARKLPDEFIERAKELITAYQPAV